MASMAGNLWQALLDNATREDEMRNSTVIVVGDKASGKSTLLESFKARFPSRPDLLSFQQGENNNKYMQQQHEHGRPAQGSPLKYSFLPAVHPDDNDADIDTAATCDIWSVSDPNHSTFLDFAISLETLSRLTIVVVLDFTRPSSMVASLKKWLQTILPEVKSKLDTHPERTTILKNMNDYVRLYRIKAAASSGEETPTGNAAATPGSDESVLSTAEIDLSEGVLTTNCGIPILVCCNKSDVIGEGNTTNIPVHVADHLQKKLRQVCLAYGASLIYVTSQTTTNPNDGSARTASTDILHRYLLHRLYPAHFKFEDAAEAIDGRGIFIPSGWDSSALIQDMEIDDGLDLLQFGKPPIATTAATGEKDEATIEATAKSAVTAYSEQSFLERLMKKQKEAESHMRVISNSKNILRDNIGDGSTSKKKSNSLETSGGGSKRSSSKDTGSAATSSTSSASTSSSSSVSNERRTKKSSDKTTKSGDNKTKDGKLIKNFFQSLLDPKGKKTTGSKSRRSGSARASTRSSSTRSSKAKEESK